jgi:hypothetical protein
MSVLEYLFSLNMMQSQCNLSEPEFLQMMLASTTGEPHLMLMRRVQEKDDVENIYHNLLLHYDKRMEPEEARIKLHSYKAPKNASLAEIEVQIQELASLVTSALPEGTAREAAYNYEQVQALIRCLPMQSSLLVRNHMNTLSARLQRPAKAVELSRFMKTHRFAIEQDIKAHGAGDQRFSGARRSYSATKPANKFTRKYSAYNISGNTSAIPPGSISNQRPSLLTSNTRRLPVRTRTNNANRVPLINRNRAQNGPARTYALYNNNTNSNRAMPQFRKPFRSPMNNGGPNRGNGNPQWKSRYASRPPQKKPFVPFNRRPTKYCSLCGKDNHTAVDGCRYMVTDSGRQVQVMPTKDTCPNCPARISPRLSHPVHLCPFRPGGPLCDK